MKLFCALKEVKDILHNVVLRNMVRESLHIKKEAFEAWRRVIEVALASCPADILPKDTRQTVISEILQDLLSKVQCIWTSAVHSASKFRVLNSNAHTIYVFCRSGTGGPQ